MTFEQFRKNTIADGHCCGPLMRNALVPVPTVANCYDFGNIRQDLSDVTYLDPVPVRLANGRHNAYGGFGVAHILEGHGDDLAHWNYHSVQDFVDDSAQTIDAVFRARRHRTLLVSRTLRNPTMNRILVVEPSRCRAYLSVVTGFMASAQRPVNGEMIAELVTKKNGVSVWERRAPR